MFRLAFNTPVEITGFDRFLSAICRADGKYQLSLKIEQKPLTQNWVIPAWIITVPAYTADYWLDIFVRPTFSKLSNLGICEDKRLSSSWRRLSFPTNFTLQFHVPKDKPAPHISLPVLAASLALPLSMLRCASPLLISLMPSACSLHTRLKSVLYAYPSAKPIPFSVIPFAVNIHTIHSIGFCKYSLTFQWNTFFFALNIRMY